MNLAKVVGTAVCSVKDPMYEGEKLLVLRPVDPYGNPTGSVFLAVDAIQSGIGDVVITLDEGGSARQVLKKPAMGTIRTVAAGFVDEASMDE